MDGDAASTDGTGAAAQGDFRLTAADLLEADHLLWRRGRLVVLAILSLYAALEIGLLLVAVTRTSATPDPFADGTAFEIVFLIGNLLVPAWLLLSLLQPRLNVRRRIRRHYEIPGAGEVEHKLVVTPDGFSITTAQSGQRFAWDEIDWWVDGKSVILLRAYNDWIILPARLAEQGIDLAAFTARFRHVDNPLRELQGVRRRRSSSLQATLRWPFRALRRRQRPATQNATQNATENATGGNATGGNATELAGGPAVAPADAVAPVQSAVYRLTVADIAAIVAATAPRPNFDQVLLFVIFGANVYASFAMLRGAEMHEAWVLICFLLFQLSLIGILFNAFRHTFLEPRRRVRAHMARGKIDTVTFSAEMHADGLRLWNDGWWIDIAWDRLRAWRRSPRLLLFSVGTPAKAYRLPRSIAASGFDLAGLEARLAGLMPAGGSWRRHPPLSPLSPAASPPAATSSHS